MTTVLEFKLGEREPGEPPPTRPCLPLTGREPGSQEEVGRAAPGGTGRWPPEHTNVEDSKDANGGLGIDKARPLCQDGHVDYNILQAGAAKLVAHGRTLTTDMFPLADFKSQISHQHLKPEEFTLKFSFLARVVSRDPATLSPSSQLVTITLQLDPSPTTCLSGSSPRC